MKTTTCRPAPLPVAVLGAGPIGLVAAAHLVQRGFQPLILEKATTIAASVRQWGHVKMFSPWRFNIDPVAREMLQKQGWKAPDEEALPTGNQLVDQFLEPLARIAEIRAGLQLNTVVTAVSRSRHNKLRDGRREKMPFVIHGLHKGSPQRWEARAVLDATGTWGNPTPMGADGLPALGEDENSDRIFYGIPDVKSVHRERFRGRRVAVVGAGHSAINTLLDLADLARLDPATRIHWVLRRARVEDTYGGQGNDALPGRGRLGVLLRQLVEEQRIQIHTPFFIDRLKSIGQGKDRAIVLVDGSRPEEDHPVCDEVVVATGARPDLRMLEEIRLDLDPTVEAPRALAPLIDPNVHSCGTVRPHGEAELRQPERDFYVVGVKSYGRAPTFLLTTGYEQVRSVVAHLAGDTNAAQRVELALPETGVCGLPGAAKPVAVGTQGQATE
ncbi:MAG: NAD(P)-binding domain-containing protein [Deltaproteobacteria bacterium]|nr:NAD(P)-binding domain-containing protein [Deltaproteobacteria bacterium]